MDVGLLGAVVDGLVVVLLTIFLKGIKKISKYFSANYEKVLRKLRVKVYNPILGNRHEMRGGDHIKLKRFFQISHIINITGLISITYQARLTRYLVLIKIQNKNHILTYY